MSPLLLVRAEARRPHRRALAALLALLAATTALVGIAVVGATSASAAVPVAISMPRSMILGSGHSLADSTGQYVLAMQAGGNFVLTAQGQQLWATGTNKAGAFAIMQPDGNLVVYTPGGTALWSSHTYGTDGQAAVTVDGNVVVSGSGGTYWQSGTLNDRLTVGHTLRAGQRLYGPGGVYYMIMQPDGNFVLYGAATPWSTRTFNHPGAYLTMQPDGNLVLYPPSGAALWSTRTFNTGADALLNLGNGKISVVAPSDIVIYQAPGVLSKGSSVVAAATGQLGRPYCFAGGDQNGPTAGWDSACAHTAGFDCSGLALYAIYRSMGVLLPHQSGLQWSQAMTYHGVRPAASQLLPGDLVFFLGFDGTKALPGHVGIYIGNNQMIDAQQSGVPVAVHTLYPGYVGAVRYWH